MTDESEGWKGRVPMPLREKSLSIAWFPSPVGMSLGFRFSAETVVRFVAGLEEVGGCVWRCRPRAHDCRGIEDGVDIRWGRLKL